MYHYKIKLYPELLSQREGIDLRETEAAVRAAAAAFSEAGEKARVKKGIKADTLIVEQDCIKFTLFCEVFLAQPSKSCKYFIQKLLSQEPYYKTLINSSGRLFRGECELIEECINETSNEEIELSDEEALTQIIRLFFRENKENRNKIEAIKTILKKRN